MSAFLGHAMRIMLLQILSHASALNAEKMRFLENSFLNWIDRAYNITSAFKDCNHTGCCAHCLNTVGNDSLKAVKSKFKESVKPLFDKLSKIVKFIKTTKNSGGLIVKVVTRTETRWYSIEGSVNSIIKNWNILKNKLQKKEKYDLLTVFKNENKLFLKEMCSDLQVIIGYMKNIEKSRKPSIHWCNIALVGLRKYLADKIVKEEALEKLDEKTKLVYRMVSAFSKWVQTYTICALSNLFFGFEHLVKKIKFLSKWVFKRIISKIWKKFKISSLYRLFIMSSSNSNKKIR